MKYLYIDANGQETTIDAELQASVERCLGTTYSKCSKQSSRHHFVNGKKLVAICCLIILILLVILAMTAMSSSVYVEEELEDSSIPKTVEIEPVTVETVAEPEVIPEVEPTPYFKPEALSNELFQVVVTECEAQGVPVNAVLAIMKTETQSFSVNSTNYNSNGTHDSGIMQINSSNIQSFAVRYNCPEFSRNPSDPVANITVGIRYFAEMYHSYYESYQDEIKTLLAASGAYNRGASNQNRYKNIYEYNARVYAHYMNLEEGKDVNIDYESEIPEIKNWLIANIQL